MLAITQEETDSIGDVLTQMLFDLRMMWLPTYEGLNFPETVVLPVFRSPLPINEKAEVEKYVALVTNQIMSATTARENLAKIGIFFAPDEFLRITQEAQLAADLAGSSLGLGAAGSGDTFNQRVDGEISGTSGA